MKIKNWSKINPYMWRNDAVDFSVLIDSVIDGYNVLLRDEQTGDIEIIATSKKLDKAKSKAITFMKKNPYAELIN